MLVVLLGLGTWQVQRLAWKQEILARIDHAEVNDPIPLPANPEPYEKVSVTGTFLPDRSATYGALVETLPGGAAMGARLIVPFRQTNGQIILVDRGWVPSTRTSPIDQPDGVVTVSGYVRFGDKAGFFSAKDDPVARQFFTLDPKAIGQSLGEPDVPAFLLVTLGPPRASEVVDQIPDPARHLPRPPNNHLSYAITWYGLAVALLIVFIVWARKKQPA
jgi:surfeit locus 1 family protein